VHFLFFLLHGIRNNIRLFKVILGHSFVLFELNTGYYLF
jgi:hypothetical protein